MSKEQIICPATGEVLIKNEGPRRDWSMPTAPTCERCGFDPETDERLREVAMIPVAHIEDGWDLGWFCPECAEEEWGGVIEWPYEQNEYADRGDLEALGFTEI